MLYATNGYATVVVILLNKMPAMLKRALWGKSEEKEIQLPGISFLFIC